jgi:hypothetical protein
MVECLLSKGKTLSSNPYTTNKKKNIMVYQERLPISSMSPSSPSQVTSCLFGTFPFVSFSKFSSYLF